MIPSYLINWKLWIKHKFLVQQELSILVLKYCKLFTF